MGPIAIRRGFSGPATSDRGSPVEFHVTLRWWIFSKEAGHSERPQFPNQMSESDSPASPRGAIPLPQTPPDAKQEARRPQTLKLEFQISKFDNWRVIWVLEIVRCISHPDHNKQE